MLTGLFTIRFALRRGTMKFRQRPPFDGPHLLRRHLELIRNVRKGLRIGRLVAGQETVMLRDDKSLLLVERAE